MLMIWRLYMGSSLWGEIRDDILMILHKLQSTENSGLCSSRHCGQTQVNLSNCNPRNNILLGYLVELCRIQFSLFQMFLFFFYVILVGKGCILCNRVFRWNLVESYPWPFDFRATDDTEHLVPYSQQTWPNFPRGLPSIMMNPSPSSCPHHGSRVMIPIDMFV